MLQPSQQLSTQDKWDLIVSNPPYIGSDEMRDMHTNVLDYEPHLALFVDNNDVQQFYRAIATFSTQHLLNDGAVFLELNAMHASATQQLFEEKGFSAIIKKDMQYKDRMLCANWPDSTIEL